MYRINRIEEASMHMVVFEFSVKEGAKDRYFELAGLMRDEIAKQPGFISIERFEAIADENKVMSVSTWEDEASILNWKQNSAHRKAQEEGKSEIFSSYRLRVAEVIRDYGFTA
jgi:heme-degrading monooxygenase HmoA